VERLAGHEHQRIERYVKGQRAVERPALTPQDQREFFSMVISPTETVRVSLDIQTR
jgi:hypothetical protein